jgi:basic membrane lipoprotein Med (substrate-binding protein (PBP1-ABC) superfamily)
VGPTNDFGYNQAAHRGAQAVQEAFPQAKVLEAENVPETGEAERMMERMIDDGATIIFPTSLGHLGPAVNTARRHPEVTFFHQGGTLKTTKGVKTTKNLHTYAGTVWEAQYLVGIAAGMATKTHKLGYVAAFPIANALLNVNAFQLGAHSVNPEVTTTVLFTSKWCDPPIQAEAATELLDQGADVLAQHQDCTKTIIETAERGGAMSAGYHFDASKLAPKGWLTGSVWNWGPLFVDMVRIVEEGNIDRSPYSAHYRAGLADGSVGLARFGAAATPEIRKLVLQALGAAKTGDLEPFAGPIKDQEGRVRIAAGEVPSPEQLKQTTDYLAEGVVGRIPES